MTCIPPIRAVRVLAVDPRPMMLRGIASTIDGLAPLLQTVATAADYAGALSKATQMRPDVTLLSLFPDAVEPTQAIRTLTGRHRSRVLVLCDIQGLPVPTAQVMQAGAVGVLRTEEAPERILAAVLEVARTVPHPEQESLETGGGWAVGLAGEAALSSAQPRPAADTRLTSRELDVVRAILAKPSAKYLAIGEILNVSEHTVHNHLTSIYRKLNVVNRTDLLHYMLRNKLAVDEMPAREVDGSNGRKLPGQAGASGNASGARPA